MMSLHSTSAVPVDPALPGLVHLTDPDALAALLETAGWTPAGPVSARLRWKPGVNARVGAIVPTTEGRDAVLATTFAAHGGKDSDLLAAGGPRAVRVGGVVVVPADTDPALARMRPGGTPLSYNPGRRWVGRVRGDGDGRVVKLHAVAPSSGVIALLTRPPESLRPFLPRTSIHRQGRRVENGWVEGRAVSDPGDVRALTTALAALHATPPPRALPTLTPRAVATAAVRAARSVADLVPGERERVTRLAARLRTALSGWPAERVVVHGDLSPDQVLVTDDGAVLLDLDRAAVGPAAWDDAHWAVAPLATGEPVPPPLGEPPPLLVLAAALLRAPEPARRLHPDRLARTRAVLDVAEHAARELT